MRRFVVLEDEVSAKVNDPSLAIRDAVTYAVATATGIESATLIDAGSESRVSTRDGGARDVGGGVRKRGGGPFKEGAGSDRRGAEGDGEGGGRQTPTNSSMQKTPDRAPDRAYQNDHPAATIDDRLISSIVTKVLVAIQPVIVEAITTAVATATKAILDEVIAKQTGFEATSDQSGRLKKNVQVGHFEVERLEQYTRKENVKIYGLEEKEDENTTDVVLDLAKKMGADVTRADLSVCHRLGSSSSRGQGQRRKPRTIIARFSRREAKSTLMKAKKNLRKKEELHHVYVNDDLTRMRGKVVQEMRKDPSILKVWTIDGKIHYIMKSSNGKDVKTIDSLDNLHELGWKENKVKELGIYLEL